MASLQSLYDTPDGVTAISNTSAFTIPAVSATQTQSFNNTSWISVGQTVLFSDGTNNGVFTVTAINGATVTLENTFGKTTGTTIAIGGRLTVTGIPGAPGTVSSASGITFTESSAPTTSSGQAAFYVTTGNIPTFVPESNGTPVPFLLESDLVAGTELLPSQSTHSGKFLTTNGTVASWATVSLGYTAGTELLPSQSTHNGKFLTTNGTVASWATIDLSYLGLNAGDELLPSQSTHSGKFLTTNGTVASWTTLPTELPSQSTHSGKYLTTDGTNPSWSTLPTEIPSVSGHSGKYLYTNGSTTSWQTLIDTSTGTAGVDLLPAQSTHSGKFLTTNGTVASWATTPTEIPSQSTHSGKFLTTNGTVVSWATLPITGLPSQSTHSGKFLTTDGSTASWATVPSVLPSQSGNSGKYLTTNGSSASWETFTVPLDVARVYTKAQSVAAVALSTSGTIAVDATASNTFTTTLTGNATLSNPSGTSSGQTLLFYVKQDATGNRTLAYGSNYKFPGGTTPTLSTAGGSIDLLSCVVFGTDICCSLIKDFS